MDELLLAKELENCLNTDLIPFWKNLIDRENGGFCGYMDNDGNKDSKAPKGGILNSRILWFFSKAAAEFGDDSLEPYMYSAFRFLIDKLWDYEYGGLYWSADYTGEVLDDTKHTYNQAFGIYGLCAYYEATGNARAFHRAIALYDLIEDKMRDEDGYLEAFSRDFSPASNEKLSENGVNATRTMNTLLHVMEAYTELYRMADKAGAEDYKKKLFCNLKEILWLIADKIYNPKLRRQEVFFDKDYRSLMDIYSYGHDIESAWLINRAVDVLGDQDTTARLKPIIDTLTSEVYLKAYRNNSIPTECAEGIVDEKRVWWVQAEAMTGFYNGYQNDPTHKEYLQATFAIWDYIKKNLVNKNLYPSEWYWYVEADGTPSYERPLVEPWKCPYHNGRMCMEMIGRIRGKDKESYLEASSKDGENKL